MRPNTVTSANPGETPRSITGVLRLCRRGLDRDEALAVLGAIREAGLGPAVLDLAEKQRVLGLILHALAKLDLLEADLGLGPGEELRAAYRLRSKWAMIVELECERVLSLLGQRSITPVVLKGAALRHQIYDAPVERAMIDLDVLVEPGELDPALQVIRAAGYQLPAARVEEAYRAHHFHLPAANSIFQVEVHWALSRPMDPLRLDAGWFRRTAVALTTPGPMTLRVPSREALLLHTAAQAASDAFGSLRHVIDTDRLLATADSSGIDWEELAAAARLAGLTRALSHQFELATRFLGTAVPMGVIPTPRLTRIHLGWLPASPTDGPEERRPLALRLIQWWILPGPGARFREAYRTIRRSQDPMQWVWHELRGLPEPRTRWFDGLFLVFKQAVYQIGVYLRQLGPKRSRNLVPRPGR